jgi:hypothetical protein
MTRYIVNPTINKTINGKRYYSTVIPTDVVEEQIQYTHVARIGDRWDTLAYKYLGSAKLWYVIASANNLLNGSIFIKPGTTVIIPEV